MRITFASTMDEVMERMLLGPVHVTPDADLPAADARAPEPPARHQGTDASDDAWPT
jgi:hypothetical protein